MCTFEDLANELARCENCLHMQNKKGQDCSLVNIFQDKNFYSKIPSIWTDWENRLDADIMIIGQDWGPFVEMKKFHDLYLKKETKENWKSLMEEEKSLTKKNLESFLLISAKNHERVLEEKFMDKIYITNAILCARSGNHYRSDSIKLKECTLNCCGFLKKQIAMVQPKVILTLGFFPLLSLSKIYGFKIEKNLTQTLKKHSLFQVEGVTIIPLYHPAAQIKKELQLMQYNKIWEIV